MVKQKFNGIRREKIGKYYYVVVRRQGKIDAKRRWSSKIQYYKNGSIKSINKEFARNLFSKNNSLDENISIDLLRNVKEVTDYRGRKPRRGSYQYMVEITKGKLKILARSQQHDYTYPKEKARDEAWESAYERLAQNMGEKYDAAIGQKEFDDGKYLSREGVVWYGEL